MGIKRKVIRKTVAILAAVNVAAVAANCFGIAPHYQVSAEAVSSVTVNPNASQECKNIINYLRECTYAGKCVFGAFNYTDYLHDDTRKKAEYNYEQIVDTYGVSPAQASFFYSPMSDKEVVKKINDRIEEYHNRGVMIVVQPGFRDIYRKYKALAESNDPEIRKKYEDVDFECITAQYDATNPNRNMEIYNERFQDLVDLGDALEDLQNRGISVICRMYVEMNNPTFLNFYSRTDEGKEHFVNVFRQTYDYLVKERGLNNFLSAWCPVGYYDSARGYYPGDEYVDIVSPTIYPQGQYDSYASVNKLSQSYYEDFLQYGKVFGYSEYGVTATSTEPGDWGILADALKQRFTKASWVNTWVIQNGFFYPTNINSEKFVHDKRLITLDGANKLPKLSGDVIYPEAGDIAIFSEKGYLGSFSGLSVGEYSASKLKEKGIKLSGIGSLRVTSGYQLTLYKGNNCTGDSLKLIADSYDVSRFKLSDYKSLSVKKIILENVSLNKPAISSDSESDPSAINDGALAYWETYNGKNSWVVIDLQGVYSIGRYEVKHASAYGELQDSNVVDYRLQYSLDGKSWKDADVVFGNYLGLVTRDIEQINAQYLRICIEKPNSTKLAGDENRAAICELSAYGIKIGDGQKSNWIVSPSVIRKPNGQIVNRITNTVTRDNSQSNPDAQTDSSPSNNASLKENSDKSTSKDKLQTEKSYLWLWITLGVVGVAIIGAGTVFLIKMSKKKSN